MNSTLSPREIQARIRSGEMLEQVAEAAGVPAEKVEPFAAPVLAERAHVAGVALTSPIRRPGEPSSNRTLRTVVTDALVGRGVDPDDVDWDAYQQADRRWIVTGTWKANDEERSAAFLYDKMGRFSVAHDDGAKDLTGELPRVRTSRPQDPDQEPTVDFTDEFAIVRAVGAEAPREEQLNPEPEPQAPAEAAPLKVVPAPVAEDEPQGAEVTDVDEAQGSDDFPTDRLDGDDEWAAPKLEKVNGVYDIVPGRGELDNLYDMFNAFAEDSVEIYPGLGEVRPVGSSAPDVVDEAKRDEAAQAEMAEREQAKQAEEEEPTGSEGTPEAGQATEEREPVAEESAPSLVPAPDAAPADAPEPARLSRRQRKRLAAAQRQQAQQPQQDAPQPERPRQDRAEQLSLVDAAEDAGTPAPQEVQPVATTPAEPKVEEPKAEGPAEAMPVEAVVDEPVELDRPVADEPEADVEAGTDAKPEEPEQTVVLPKKRTPAKKKRASVPSWDEIMFGGPKQG